MIKAKAQQASKQIGKVLKRFSYWDYLLGLSTLSTPAFLGLPYYYLVLSAAATSACLLMPRNAGTYQQKSEQESPEYVRINQLVSKICEERNLSKINHIILRHKPGTPVDVVANIDKNNQQFIVIYGDIQSLTNQDLSILLEHEIAHLHFKDSKAKSYIDRLYYASVGLSLLAIPNNLITTLILGTSVTLIRQACIRYRELRADRFAIADAQTNKINPEKTQALKEVVAKINHVSLDARAKADNEFFFTKVKTHLINSYTHPETISESLTHKLLELCSSHPTVHQRYSFK
ncbi:M48 family metalloprotease [Candidatus Berkiella aquae]|uniref:Heat shock protein HtpX n=1 Tax=Candidatus Berkiella aquae TaxID=295108 RepID=A0A0Q9YKC6_9GAMM|nr:M48 family metalloprotease [Candidatus Berkiella aquae]MCS5711206.1 M48 family metalloprotease [Candidatus Berkiella aquae]